VVVDFVRRARRKPSRRPELEGPEKVYGVDAYEALQRFLLDHRPGHHLLPRRINSNGAHSANGLAALFIATGQDAANIAESQAAITYSQLLDNGDYYWSITLTSLIVATYGGGTGLATQKECLDVLGCCGKGKANKFAEICAAVVLAGETSLAGAVLHGDWVSAHERLGRNRP